MNSFTKTYKNRLCKEPIYNVLVSPQTFNLTKKYKYIICKSNEYLPLIKQINKCVFISDVKNPSIFICLKLTDMKILLEDNRIYIFSEI